MRHYTSDTFIESFQICVTGDQSKKLLVHRDRAFDSRRSELILKPKHIGIAFHAASIKIKGPTLQSVGTGYGAGASHFLWLPYTPEQAMRLRVLPEKVPLLPGVPGKRPR
jgi:hypothetical protein